jgi:hypothetical protein
MVTWKKMIGRNASVYSLDSADKSEKVLHTRRGQMARIDWASHITDYHPRATIRIKKHNTIQGLR